MSPAVGSMIYIKLGLQGIESYGRSNRTHDKGILSLEEKRVAVYEMYGINNSMDMSLNKFWEIVKDREACSSWGHKESDTTQ